MRWARSRSPRIGSQAESKQQIATCICVGVRQLGEIGSIRITCCVRDGLFRCRRAAVSVGDGVAAFSGEQQEDMMIQRGRQARNSSAAEGACWARAQEYAYNEIC